MAITPLPPITATSSFTFLLLLAETILEPLTFLAFVLAAATAERPVKLQVKQVNTPKLGMALSNGANCLATPEPQQPAPSRPIS